MQNIEFKAEIRDIAAARRQCALVGAVPAGRFRQSDLYFRVPEGRLKRRESRNDAGAVTVEWIFYRRPDTAASRIAQYTILTDEQARVRFGEGTLTAWKRVVKTRELWMVGNVRVHLDEVEGLGQGIEFEAVVSPRHDLAECRMMVQHLREQFAPIMGEAIAGSYESLAAELPPEDQRQAWP
jgi:adenylate cyclase class IV